MSSDIFILGKSMDNDIIESQMYWNGESFEVECPLCFCSCYVFSEEKVVCESNIEHRFSLC